MFFLSRLEQLLSSESSEPNLLAWQSDLRNWSSGVLAKLPEPIAQTIDAGWLQSQLSRDNLRGRVLELEEAIWSELGPTQHPATNRLVHCLESGQDMQQVVGRELLWGRAQQSWQPVRLRQDDSESIGAAFRALRAELSAFQESHLGLLEVLQRDISTGTFAAGAHPQELVILGNIFASIDLAGFCRRNSSGPTQLALLNCYLRAAWEVQQSRLSDRVFAVIKDELLQFFGDLQRQQELLLAVVPSSRGLSTSLRHSLQSLPELARQIDLLETSDLGSAKAVESGSRRILEAYRNWDWSRQELLVVSGSQDEQLWLSGLWQDCQAVQFEDLEVAVLRGRVQQISAAVSALGELARSLARLCSEPDRYLAASDWCDQLGRRLDFVELFADQPNLETLRLVRQELLAQIGDLDQP